MKQQAFLSYLSLAVFVAGFGAIVFSLWQRFGPDPTPPSSVLELVSQERFKAVDRKAKGGSGHYQFSADKVPLPVNP